LEAVGNAALRGEPLELGRAHAGLPAVRQDEALDVLAHAIREDPPALAPAAVFDHWRILGTGALNARALPAL